MAKKLNEKRDNLDVDLDAMLDEAESSLFPINEFQDDEDAIDRLLMNAGFDTEDVLTQAELNNDVVKDLDLQDLLNNADFGEDFNEPPVLAVEVEAEPVVEDSSTAIVSEEENDDFFGLSDDFDELNMLHDQPAETSPPAQLDLSAVEIDESNDFSDFRAAEEAEVVQSIQATVSALVTDELDDLSGLTDVFDLSDRRQTQESTPADIGLSADEIVAEPGLEENPLETQNDFSDFSAFAEPEMVKEVDQPVKATEPVSDEFDDLSDFADDLDTSEIRENPMSTPVEIAGVESDLEEIEYPPEEVNDFSDFSAFAEPDVLKESEEAEQTPELSPADANLPDELDDLFGLADDFDEADMLEDDQVEAKNPAVADLSPSVVDQESAIEDENDFFKQIEAQLAEAENLSKEASLLAANEGAQAVIAQQSEEEDFIGSLLLDTGFDTENGFEQDDAVNDAADLSEIDDFFQLDEVSDDFSKQIEDQLAEAENLSTEDVQENDFLLPDFDITADGENFDSGNDIETIDENQEDPFADTDSLIEDEAMLAVAQEAPKIEETVTRAEDDDIEKSTPFGFEQVDVKKQLEEAKNTVKKIRLLAYVALGFAVVAISAAVGLGVMTYRAENEVSKLTETVSTLEASLATIAEHNPKEEINTMITSVVQLNQQVYSFITELKGIPQFPLDVLGNKITDVASKQDMVSKALASLQVKIGGEKTVPAIVEPPKIEATHELAPAKGEHAHETLPVKSEAAHEPTKEIVAHEPASTKKEASQELAPPKDKAKPDTAKVEAKPEKEIVKVEAKSEKITVKADVKPEVAAVKVKIPPEVVLAKPASIPKTAVKEVPVALKEPEAAGIWGVNLVAFKQEWFAKSKAAEFARQGIFAEVVPVPGNMYRLRVGGFKNKAEANANKDRIKRALNLDSVWVSDN